MTRPGLFWFRVGLAAILALGFFAVLYFYGG
jgi:hypothetical protein